ncbi:hypothetical protein OUZ56_028566 [Daphnia magna]|uniref:Uncharacterized protein n=1 Tax=Daphnia magna TaxID=35525 RepID=A0ABR0B492_9CRUS|nr:hypothetical protein OUZ56_028566 [Daphnia magna]
MSSLNIEVDNDSGMIATRLWLQMQCFIIICSMMVHDVVHPYFLQVGLNVMHIEFATVPVLLMCPSHQLCLQGLLLLEEIWQLHPMFGTFVIGIYEIIAGVVTSHRLVHMNSGSVSAKGFHLLGVPRSDQRNFWRDHGGPVSANDGPIRFVGVTHVTSLLSGGIMMAFLVSNNSGKHTVYVGVEHWTFDLPCRRSTIELQLISNSSLFLHDNAKST